MSRIHQFGGTSTPQTPEEIHDKNERGKAASTGDSAKGGSAAQAPDQDGVRKIIEPQDAERLFSQAGFARGKKKRPGDLDMGDSSSAPIPLPDDDVDSQIWSQQALSQVQTQLGLQGGIVRKLRQQGAGAASSGSKSLFAALMGEAVDPESVDAQRLAALPDSPPPDAEALAHMASQAQAHFGLELSGLDTGSQLLAASMLVAGLSSQVAVVAGTSEAPQKTLDGQKLAAGVEAVLDGGRAAVDDGRRMNEGVSKNLAMHRTFVAKR